jgi:hypothetical protein
MKRVLSWSGAAALPLLLAACGAPSTTTMMMPPPVNMDPVSKDPTGVMTATDIEVTTGEFTVPPGDSFECFYSPLITDHEVSVANAEGMQAAGGHHVTVYYTTIKKDVQHHPCIDSEMAEWNQVGAANGSGINSGEGAVSLPPGAALKIPAGVQIVTQFHYINATTKTLTTNDEVKVHIVDPATVKQYVNLQALNDTSWQLPPQQMFEHSSTCTLNKDINAIIMIGHMHELGKHYKLEQLDANDQPVLTYEYDWQPSYASHPPLKTWGLDNALLLKKGTKFRMTCRWDNTTTDTVGFPREMCIGVMFYFPDQGMDVCDTTPL